MCTLSLALTGCNLTSNSSDSSGEVNSGESTGLTPLEGTVTIAGFVIEGISVGSGVITNQSGEFHFDDNQLAGALTLGTFEIGTVADESLFDIAEIGGAALPTHYSDFVQYSEQLIHVTGMSHVNVARTFYSPAQPLDVAINRFTLLAHLDQSGNYEDGIQLSGASIQTEDVQASQMMNSHNFYDFLSDRYPRSIVLEPIDSLMIMLQANGTTIEYPLTYCSGSANAGSFPTRWASTIYNDDNQILMYDRYLNECVDTIPTVATLDALETNGDQRLEQLYEYEAGSLVKYYSTTTPDFSTFTNRNDYNNPVLVGLTGSEFTSVTNSYNSLLNREEIVNTERNENGTVRYEQSFKYTGTALESLSYHSQKTYTYADAESEQPESASLYYSSSAGPEVDLTTDYLFRTFYEYEYNEFDQITLDSRSDYNSSDENTAVNTYGYERDDEGRLLARLHNVDAKTDHDDEATSEDDRNYEYAYYYTYFDDGRLNSAGNVNRDYGGTLVHTQRRYVFSFDDLNRFSKMSVESDANQDGTYENIYIRAAQYNELGQLSHYCTDDECESGEAYYYNDKGLIERKVEFSSGTANSVIKVWYEAGLISKVRSYKGAQFDSDNQPLNVDTYTDEATYTRTSQGAMQFTSIVDKLEYYDDPSKVGEESDGYYHWKSDVDGLKEHLDSMLFNTFSLEFADEET
jgi:hypothetical protein